MLPLLGERKIEREKKFVSSFRKFRYREEKREFVMMSLRRGGERQDFPAAYNVVHKLPHGDSPYVRAKHVQVIERKKIYIYIYINTVKI